MYCMHVETNDSTKEVSNVALAQQQYHSNGCMKQCSLFFLEDKKKRLSGKKEGTRMRNGNKKINRRNMRGEESNWMSSKSHI